MEIKTAELIYFSPTGTTRKTVRAVAEGTGVSILRETDLTQKENRAQSPEISADLLILGVPVYAGGVPPFLLPCLRGLRGGGQPTVLVAVYGGIDCGIALNQLSEILTGCGYMPAAAGTFIGEHSFSTSAVPVAQGRPDARDLAAAKEFGKKSVHKILAAKNASGFSLRIPEGKVPLPGRLFPKSAAKLFARAPQFRAKFCPRCGACARICPMDAIDPKTLQVDKKACIRCFACVRVCPKGARTISFRFGSAVPLFLQRESGARKEPVCYL